MPINNDYLLFKYILAQYTLLMTDFVNGLITVEQFKEYFLGIQQEDEYIFGDQTAYTIETLCNDINMYFEDEKELLKKTSEALETLTRIQQFLKTDMGILLTNGIRNDWAQYTEEAGAQWCKQMKEHINLSDTYVIQGSYRGHSVIHYVNPDTRINVIVSPEGDFFSSWQLSIKQLENVLKGGVLW